MDRRTYRTDDLQHLDGKSIDAYLRDLLCDDSTGDCAEVLLSRPDYRPDSFTVADTFCDPSFLLPCERDTHQYLRAMVASEVKRATQEGLFALSDPVRGTDFIVQQLQRLLEYQLSGTPVSARLFNQELPDVVRKVVAFCFFGDPNVELHTSRSFNAMAERVIPVLLERHLLKHPNIHELLAYSIAAGVIGLDLKGAKAAASSFTNMGIRLQPLLNLDPTPAADAIYRELEPLVSVSFAIDYWDAFSDEALSGAPYKLVWFLDDVIETMFDLHLAQRLLEQNQLLSITIVPKNGQHGNDASCADVLRFLGLPLFSPLRSHKESGRLCISRKGPRMGTVNIRKLSPEVVDEVKTADAVYVKGCRVHEMLQGGINMVTYTSFIVTREFTESETGLDARCAPIVFLRNEPGECAYWGFKGRKSRQRRFPDGREIHICYSTTEEHELRKTTDDPRVLITELNKLVSLNELVPSEHRYQYDAETRLVVNRMSDLTRLTYNATTERYSHIRGQEPNKANGNLMADLQEMARARAREGRLGGKDGTLFVLDVGTGHGRDLRYLSRFDDVRAFGIDNAEAFIETLDARARDGEIPKGSYFKMDMRDMRGFKDESFDAIRHNATLLHLPMLPNRIGADEAVAESFRILRPFGIVFVFVKEGEGLQCTDTAEGLGLRIYQYHTRNSLINLLERNGFKILRIGRTHSRRPTGRIGWIFAFAEKPAGRPTE